MTWRDCPRISAHTGCGNPDAGGADRSWGSADGQDAGRGALRRDDDRGLRGRGYVKVTAANVGKVALAAKSSPATYVNGIDDRGQDQNEVIFLGDFPRCEAKLPKAFEPGDSHTTCLTYLIPEGGSLKGMRWIAFDEKTGKSNIEWKRPLPVGSAEFEALLIGLEIHTGSARGPRLVPP